ncbi:MAG: hypothetical protein MUD14_29095 [Hydrococcus sp. Prado102]|jgi:hypothetical protein|nr:hypothetical protein [Hydrococcus sp. Prado102]
MNLLSDLLAYFNLIAIPIYCYRRFKKHTYLIFLNPCFYLLIVSYLYLTISSILINPFIELIEISFPLMTFRSDSIQATNILCNWYTFVFFIFYIFSTERKIVLVPYTPKKITYQIALLFTFIVSTSLFLILLLQGPLLLATSGRAESIEIFAQEFLEKYRLIPQVNVLLGSLAVIVWRNKNFKWYLVLITPIILELLSRGRTMSFSIIVFAYLNYLTITKKLALVIIIGLLTLLISTVLLRSTHGHASLTSVVFINLSELLYTRVTTIITYDNFMNHGDLNNYLLSSFFKWMPNLIFSLFFERGESYVLTLRNFYEEKYNISIGLAGNIVSESLFYGGVTFALITPLIIGGIFYLINKLKIYKTFPGFIYFCLLMATLRIYIRQSFYDNFLLLTWLMFSYLIWITVLERKKQIFITASKNNFFLNQPSMLNK